MLYVTNIVFKSLAYTDLEVIAFLMWDGQFYLDSVELCKYCQCIYSTESRSFRGFFCDRLFFAGIGVVWWVSLQ